MSEKITAEKRTEFGKGAARRIRRADKIPAVLYGHGTEPVHMILPGHATMLALKHGGANAILDIDLEGEAHLGLTKQVQIDPIKRHIEHVDMVVVKRGEKVSVEVPVHVTGEIVRDGLLTTELQTIEVEADAMSIPEWIEIDVEGFEVGKQLHASDLALPAGSTLLTDGDALVLHVSQAPTADDVDAEMTEAEAEAGIEKDEAEDTEEA
ncbi:50S ribosomal protein L25/general stress protein Ctc [Nocardioides bruguierae]|uniref:Large ribosomal subunit protein bL25 n=1 Tax=Nocardioides bruguierae TaxID=2945102 RepID=A0A9X2IE95_9ACTN|nr:50S ribosomal protein L25/general stress protein Ctc [Nocardioides bruguierae]MCM0620062.1 50S ribosomal protein L25/general stress protein Ctc [Nocardioides bruguierae]